MIALAQYGPSLIFLIGMLLAASVVVRFNLKTSLIAKQIKKLAASEGKEWEFWGQPDQLRKFLFRPSAIIEPNDSIAICTAKQSLVAHRQTMWRSLFLGWGIVLVTVVSSVLFVVVLSQLA